MRACATVVSVQRNAVIEVGVIRPMKRIILPPLRELRSVKISQQNINETRPVQYDKHLTDAIDDLNLKIYDPASPNHKAADGAAGANPQRSTGQAEGRLTHLLWVPVG